MDPARTDMDVANLAPRVPGCPAILLVSYTGAKREVIIFLLSHAMTTRESAVHERDVFTLIDSDRDR